MESLMADLLAKCYYQKHKRMSARITQPFNAPPVSASAESSFDPRTAAAATTPAATEHPPTLDPAAS